MRDGVPKGEGERRVRGEGVGRVAMARHDLRQADGLPSPEYTPPAGPAVLSQFGRGLGPWALHGAACFESGPNQVNLTDARLLRDAIGSLLTLDEACRNQKQRAGLCDSMPCVS